MRCIQEEIVILEIIIIVYSFELANKQKGKKPLRHVLDKEWNEMRQISRGHFLCELLLQTATRREKKFPMRIIARVLSFSYVGRLIVIALHLSVLKQSKNINKSWTNMFCRQSTYCLIWMICLVLWFHIAIQFIKYVYTNFPVYIVLSFSFYLFIFFPTLRLNVNLSEN